MRQLMRPFHTFSLLIELLCHLILLEHPISNDYTDIATLKITNDLKCLEIHARTVLCTEVPFHASSSFSLM